MPWNKNCGCYPVKVYDGTLLTDNQKLALATIVNVRGEQVLPMTFAETARIFWLALFNVFEVKENHLTPSVRDIGSDPRSTAWRQTVAGLVGYKVITFYDTKC